MKIYLNYRFYFLLITSFFILQLSAKSQVTQKNYLLKNYSTSGENFDVTFDKEGNLLIANSKGLLLFNGSEFKLFPLPNNKPVFALCYVNEKFIYVGSDNEFGFFIKNKFGNYEYFSLTDSIHQTQQNSLGKIKFCKQIKDKIYFGSEKKIIVNQGRQLTITEAKKNQHFTFFDKYNNEIYFHESNNGLIQISPTITKRISDDIKNLELKGLKKNSDKSYYLFTNKGIYSLVDGKLNAFHTNLQFKILEITDAKILNEQNIISTSNEGILILNDSFDLQYKIYENKLLSKSNKISTYSDNEIVQVNGHQINLIRLDTLNKLNSGIYGKVKLDKMTNCIADSLLPLRNLILPFGKYNLKFQYSFSAFEPFYNIKWYYKLCKDNNESEWVKTEHNYIQLNNLKDGNYKLKIKAELNNSIIGQTYFYFSINPPWYRSSYALIIYTLIFFQLLFFLRKKLNKS